MAVLKLTDGRVVVAYRKGTHPDDPQRTREYFGRGPTALRAALTRNAELGLGGRVQKKKSQTADGFTFGDIAGLYQQARMGKNTATTNTARYYKLKSVILPELGHLPVHRLTHHRLDQYVNKRLKSPVTVWIGPEKKRRRKVLKDADGRPRCVKATTVHRELSDIMAVMAWALKTRKIAFNPAAGYEKPKRDDDHIRPPSPAEVRRLIDNAPEHLVRAITIAWYTGIRPGAVELFSLRWADVDFSRRALFVTSARKGGPATRMVPMDEPFAATLYKWYQADGQTDQGYLISYHGKRITRIKRAWDNTKRAAGITRRLRPYDIRHAFVTYLLEGGGDLKSVSAMAGHSRTETTTRIYQHLSMDLMRTTIGKLPPIAKTGDAGPGTTDWYTNVVPIKKPRKRKAGKG